MTAIAAPVAHRPVVVRQGMTGQPAPARPVPHPAVTRAGIRPSAPTGGAGQQPLPRRDGVDPWQFHEYALRIARLETSAWDAAAEAVERAAVETRALVALLPGPRAVGVLGSRLGLTSGGATKLCRRLGELGLIERQAVDHDQRGVEVVLTDMGRYSADRAAKVYAEHIASRTARSDLAPPAPRLPVGPRPVARPAA